MTCKITLCQLNYSAVDIESNKKKIISHYHNFQSSDIVIFSELSLTGYLPNDLLLDKSYLRKIKEVILEISHETNNKKTSIIIGVPIEDGSGKLYNAALHIKDGSIHNMLYKHFLPNYNVFNESRYFYPKSNINNIINVNGYNLAILICEDFWHTKNISTIKKKTTNNQDIDALIAINASPFEKGKYKIRRTLAQENAAIAKCPVIYLNQVGGYDGVVFDGNSFLTNKKGEQVLAMKSFCEDTLTVELDSLNNNKIANPSPDLKISNELCSKGEASTSAYSKVGEKQSNDFCAEVAERLSYEEIYQALMLGLGDYVNKSGFKNVVIGLSGGIDSALCLCLASDILGPNRVKTFMLPSWYTSASSITDARKIANNLGISLDEISIEPSFSALKASLSTIFQGVAEDTTEENMQPRIRGNILMSIANKFSALLLSCSNKSEVATGYTTIYGDMCGGFAPIKDVYKTEVYRLAEWRNNNIPQNSLSKINKPIPNSIIEKAPSAELRPNQKDQDTLPEYEVLDKILYELIENQQGLGNTVEKYDEKVVRYVYNLLIKSEHKRKQAPIGTKISSKSFGDEWQYKIT